MPVRGRQRMYVYPGADTPLPGPCHRRPGGLDAAPGGRRAPPPHRRTGDWPGGDADVGSAARVADARDRMGHRLSGTPWRRNGDIPRHELSRSYPPADDGLALIGHATDLGMISNLGAAHVTAVAWTLADLVGRPRPSAAECAQALAFWTGTGR